MSYHVETMEKCNRFMDKLRANGYTIDGSQYRADAPEGYHIWFWKSGQPLIEIVTHNPEVEDALVRFAPTK